MWPKHLEEERTNLRAFLRRTHWGVPPDAHGYLDDAELLLYADSMGGGVSAPLRVDLMGVALLHLGVPETLVRERYHVAPERRVALERRDFILDPKYAAAIEAEVLRQLPELPEPSRGPAPVAAGFGQDVGEHPTHPAYTSGDFNVP